MYINRQPAIVPIIGLRSGFTLRFDEMSDDANEFFYKVVHCDRHWRASDLEEIEYIDGFNGEEIQNYEFSTNTYVDYVNFSLTLPNEDTRFKISGNYILIIYDDDQLTNPVLTRRFMIDENIAQLYTDFQRVYDVTKSNTHQQLDVEVDLKEMRIGDEFRQFDIRSLQYTTPFVAQIDLHDLGSDVLLHVEKPRAYTHYQDEFDFDGRYIVQTFDFPSSTGNQGSGQDSESNYRADYANIIFALKTNESLDEVYVMGPFNDWRIDEAYKMKYVDGKGYYLNTPLKQGVYNYLFATKGADGLPNYDTLEGDSEKTVNYYTIILYYRDFTQQYDRILDTQLVRATGEY